MREYHNTERKNKLWADKASDLNVDPLRLQTWVDSMRTRFARLTQTKSGQGVKEYTESETWRSSISSRHTSQDRLLTMLSVRVHERLTMSHSA